MLCKRKPLWYNEPMISIYMLTDPTGADTCYVGSTRNPKLRLIGHCADMGTFGTAKSRWLKMLAQRGLKPILTVLDTVPENERAEVEGDAIAMVRAVRGEHCVNVQLVPRKYRPE